MQFFRTEGFDTFGKALPRATDIARQLLMVYCGLTFIIIVVYSMIGMTALDAVVHGFATVATGGFSPTDISFSKYPGAGEYFGALFMVLSALPYIRFVQLVNGSSRPLWQDLQVRAFLRWLLAAVLAVTLWRVVTAGSDIEPTFREALFNLTSIMTGTGFFSGTFGGWGGFSMVVAFVAGLVGGCSGSSSGALTVFRVQIALTFLGREIRRISNPSAVDPVKYDGRTVGEDVLNAVVMFVSGYIVIIGLLSTAMTLTGVDSVSAMFAVWQAMGNIGYGFGPLMAPTGTFVDFPPAAIVIMTVAMILGRLGLVALLLLLLPAFWRR
jgi:trk system potassium uptake protein TrkH